MKLNILAFGIAKEILGFSRSELGIEESISIMQLKEKLVKEHPEFSKLSKFDVAVNEEYREDDFLLTNNDEVAIIPPVSGG